MAAFDALSLKNQGMIIMKERIITGLIMALVTLLGIIYLPTPYFALGLLIITLIGASEWTRLMQLAKPASFRFMLIYALLAVIFYYCSLGKSSKNVIDAFTGLMTIFWMIMPFLLFRHRTYPIKFLTDPRHLYWMSLTSLSIFFISLIQLHAQNIAYVFLVILLVAGADSMAYFVGRKIGKHKLAPTISPGKSIEGAIAGIGSCMIIGFIAAFCLSALAILPMSFAQILGLTLLSGVIAVVSISGDLFESLIKRHAGIKDSGNILPGHGGILDRIDALTAAVPVFTCGLLILGL